MTEFSGAAAAMIVALVPLAAAAAYAQEAPKGGPKGPPDLWRLGLNADAMWYENGTFTGTSGDSTWSTGGRASLDYSRRFRTGTFGIGGWGGTIYYPEEDGLRQATYGGSLSLNVTPSPRTRINLSQSFARTNTRQLTYVTPDVPLPTTGLYYLDSTAGLTHGLSRTWQVSLSSGFFARRYDSPSLVDGADLQAGVQLARVIGASGNVFASYQFTNAWYDRRAGQPGAAAQSTSQAHQMLLGANHTPKRGLSFGIAGGAAYLLPSQTWYPAGNAQVSAAGRHTSLNLTYARDFGQAFGYGRQTISDIATAAAGWTPVERFTFSVGYTYAYRRDSELTTNTIRSQVVSGGVSVGDTKGFSGAARYSWEQNQTEGRPPLEGGRVTATISYGVEWR